MSRVLLRTSTRLAARQSRPPFAPGPAVLAARWSSSSSDPTTKEVVAREQEAADSKAVDQIRPEGAAVAAGAVSGFPEEIHQRPVRIFQPTPTTMQSARSTSHTWRLDWDVLQGSGRWENPLMGWASSADYMQGTKINFETKEDAVAFCEKQGWPYYVQDTYHQRFKPKSYSNNFLYSSGPLRIVKTK